MERILGRLLIICLIACNKVSGAPDALIVKMFDTQHQEIHQVGIGQPFTIEVVAKGENASQRQAIFENLECINGRRSGYQMNSINGNTTIVYTYQARIDKEGTYTVGPIRCGNMCVNDFTIVAGKTNLLVNTKEEKKQKAMLQFFVDTHDVVIGEKINCRLRFLHGDRSIELRHIGQQDIAGITQSAAEGPFEGEDTINGIAFKYKEWRWTTYVEQAGEYLIPAHYADYTMRKKQHAFWGGFAHLFDDHDIKRVYSNAEKITVHAFDDAVYPVCAIGQDISVQASVDHVVVTQSEGITLRIDITGDKDSSLRPIQTLENIPPALRWCRSESSKINECTLRSEFIIQGLKSGDYEIPAQHLCYFDRETREYKNIQTEPLTISITPLRDPAHHSTSFFSQPLQEEKNELRSAEEDQIPLSCSRWYKVSRRAALPWWFFITMLVLIAVCGMSAYIIQWPVRFFHYSSRYREYKKAFIDAQRAIEHARGAKDERQLYDIFIKLLNMRCRLPSNQICSQSADYTLQDYLKDDTMRQRWSDFFCALEQAAYGRVFFGDQLFEQAIEWINILKKIM